MQSNGEKSALELYEYRSLGHVLFNTTTMYHGHFTWTMCFLSSISHSLMWIAILRLTNNNPTFEKVYPSKGFGWYLSNSFVSIARSQMLESIIKLEIMTEEEVKEALGGGENARLRIDYANK